VKAEHPEWGIGDIAKEIGGMWRALSAEDKVPYEDRGKADKERYVNLHINS
jgi:hypothetical protein